MTKSFVPGFVIALAASTILFSCAPAGGPVADSRLSGPASGDLLTLAAVANPPSLSAKTPREIDEVANSVIVATVNRFEGRRGVRQLQVSAIPFLRATPAGNAFLQQSGPRALARGEPAALCPAAAASDPASANRAAAVSSAFTTCLGILQAESADPSCGCRLMAVDQALLMPQSAFSFAPVVSALLIDSDGRAERLVAESVGADAEKELVLLRDAVGERGRMILAGDLAEAILADPDGRALTGVRERFGYRRGRIAERVRLITADGEEVIILVGVEMRDAVKPR